MTDLLAGCMPGEDKPFKLAEFDAPDDIYRCVNCNHTIHNHREYRFCDDTYPS